jgi:tRNA A-37 threonylcarbamoyl transferase component Bud32
MMSTISTCPDEDELLPIATGEPADEDLAAHLGECEICRERVDRLRAEVAALCPGPGGGPDGGPTGQGPAEGEGNPAAPEGWEDLFSKDAARDLAEVQSKKPVAIDKYLVVGLLDVGAEGEVYRVIHPDLDREMVLKLAHQRVVGDERASLLIEGQILVDLEHINLLRVYGSGFHDDRPYLVMEYVRGSNLEDYLRDHPVTQQRAAALVARLASALDLVHRKKIIHRDIKPRNILIDEAGEPRLIDFGLALLRNAWSDPFAAIWGGTVAYMAPEQARREHDRIGARSDIFGLGAVLFFLLTGRPPFVGETPDEVWDRARRCEIGAGALREARVPRRLERICLKALAADPDKRYPSAEAFGKALRRYLVGPKVLGVLSGVCGFVLLGSLVFAQVWPRLNSVIPSVPTPTTQAAPLAGELTVRVWSKEGGAKRGLKIEELGALPLLPGERVQIEARLNQPAHVFLLWVNSRGEVIQLWPRDDGKFGSRPSDGSPRETVHSPEALDEGHKMGGPGGLETVLLLARRTPLPPGRDVTTLIGTLPASPLRDEREFAVRGFDEGRPTEALRVGLHRGIDAMANTIDDPLLRMMERLRAKCQFDLIKAVRFAYRGE